MEAARPEGDRPGRHGNREGANDSRSHSPRWFRRFGRWLTTGSATPDRTASGWISDLDLVARWQRELDAELAALDAEARVLGKAPPVNE